MSHHLMQVQGQNLTCKRTEDERQQHQQQLIIVKRDREWNRMAEARAAWSQIARQAKAARAQRATQEVQEPRKRTRSEHNSLPKVLRSRR